MRNRRAGQEADSYPPHRQGRGVHKSKQWRASPRAWAVESSYLVTPKLSFFVSQKKSEARFFVANFVTAADCVFKHQTWQAALQWCTKA